MSNVIRDCIGFALLRSVIGLENSRHPLNQSDAKVKPIATWSLAFSRAWDRLRVFTLSSHWFVVITLVLVLRHSIEKRSIQLVTSFVCFSLQVVAVRVMTQMPCQIWEICW